MRLFVVLLVAVTLTGCRNDPTGETPSAAELKAACALVPGCEQAIPVTATPTETIWRVQVIRAADGAVRFGEAEAILVTEGNGVPLGVQEGPYMLIGLDGGEQPVDGQYIDFPEEVRVEWEEDGFGAATTRSLEGIETSAVGYVRALPEIQRLILADASGREAASSPVPSRVAVNAPPPAPLLAGMGSPLAAAVLPAILAAAAQDKGEAENKPEEGLLYAPAHCAHVKLLEGPPDAEWGSGIEAFSQIDLIVAGPVQRAVLLAAMEMMPPLLCHGVGRIALGILKADAPDWADGSANGVVDQWSGGDMVMLNAGKYSEDRIAASGELRLRMIATFIHEATHATEAMLNAPSNPEDYGGNWRPASRNMATQTLDRVRLRTSLIQEWTRVHESFVDHGWADNLDKANEAVANWTAAQTAQVGAMTRFGATDYAEDIAEMVEWIHMARYFRAAGIPEGAMRTEDFGCQMMRLQQSDGLPSNLSAFYTKVSFLRDLGLVREDDVRTCLGRVDVTAGIDAPGFHVIREDGSRSVFDTELSALMGALSGGSGFQSMQGWTFEITAKGQAQYAGESYPTTLRLRLALDKAVDVPAEQVTWPRGLYKLGSGLLLTSLMGASSGEFTLQMEGAAAGNFDVTDGFALVAEASSQRIAGSIVIQRSERPRTPSFIPIPQTFDPPQVIRFLAVK